MGTRQIIKGLKKKRSKASELGGRERSRKLVSVQVQAKQRQSSKARKDIDKLKGDDVA